MTIEDCDLLPVNTPPKLSFACPVSLASMSGPDRLKYCGQCGHHLQNLSLLSVEARAALLERAKTERICGSYWVRTSGEMVTPEAPLSLREKLGIKQFGVAVLSAAALAVVSGCISRPEAAALPQNEPARQAEVTSASSQSTSSETGKIQAKKDDEDVILLSGFFVCPPPPQHVPGHIGK